VRLGVWLFIASEVMLFGALFSAYALLRTSATSWPSGSLDTGMAIRNTVTLAIITTVWWRIRAGGRGAPAYMWGTAIAALVFLVSKGLEYRHEIAGGFVPSTNTFFAMYFTLTGLHAWHVLGGLVANLWVWRGVSRVSEAMSAGRIRAVAIYWAFVDVIWLIILLLFYFS
jgi:heme/copper-type cytochrome/quinol oxidase subunit 3